MKGSNKLIAILALLVLMISTQGCGQGGLSSYKADLSVLEDGIDLGGKTIEIVGIKNTFLGNDGYLKLVNDELGVRYNCNIVVKDFENGYGSEQLLSDILAGKFESDIIYYGYNFPLGTLINKGAIIPLDDYIDFKQAVFNNPIQSVAFQNGKH